MESVGTRTGRVDYREKQQVEQNRTNVQPISDRPHDGSDIFEELQQTGGNDLVHGRGRMKAVDEDAACSSSGILTVEPERLRVSEDLVEQLPR